MTEGKPPGEVVKTMGDTVDVVAVNIVTVNRVSLMVNNVVGSAITNKVRGCGWVVRIVNATQPETTADYHVIIER